MANDKNGLAPPVLAFKSLRSAIQGLRTHGLPPEIDRSAWDNRSGTEQTQIIAALKFLGLLDDKQLTQQSLKDLTAIAEDSAEEKQFWRNLLRERYDNAFSLDLSTATPNQLEDSIATYGVKGLAKERAVRFFLKAATHAGIPLSPRLTKKLRERSAGPSNEDENGWASEGSESANSKGNGKPPLRKRNASRNPKPVQPPAPGASTNAMKTIKLRKVDGSLSITGTFNPFLLVGEERDLVYEIIDLMTEYEAKAQSPS